MNSARLPIAFLVLIAFLVVGAHGFAQEHSPQTVELEVTVRVQAETFELEPTPAVVRLRKLGGVQEHFHADDHLAEERSAEERSAELTVPGNVRLALPRGEIWKLALEAPELWAPEATWQAESNGSVVLTALPTGELVGRAATSPGDGEPQKMEARFQASDVPAHESDPDRHTVKCQLDAESRFRCEIPAGKYDIRLRAPGFVSHYFWNLDLPAAGKVDLGDLHLRAGSSLVTWVKTEEAPEDFAFSEVTASLLPETAGLQEIAEDHQRRQLLLMESLPNEHGFLEFIGMTPGTYRLEVSHPDFATARFSPVTIVEGAETEIDEIVLRPPLGLTVSVDPPYDPRGRSWLLGLSKYSDVPGHLDRIARGASNSEGRWRAGGLDSGHYRLVVADGQGERWATHEIRLEGEDERVQVELPFERVEGRVTLGGEPLPKVRVWFGGRHGEVRVSDTTNEDGAVYVIVPERDSWLVEIRSKHPPIVARLDEVEVYDHPTQPWRRADIELPKTALTGVVLGPGGNPVAEAKVRMTREELPARFFIERTDDEGHFAVEAIKNGKWRLQAEWHDEIGRRWLSDGIDVALAEDEAREVELQLKQSWSFSGQVVGPSGAGVYGAEVSGLPVYPDGGERGTYLARAISGLSGEFELEVPAEAVAVELTILPPGFTARKWPPFERGTEPQVLSVDQYSGTLRILGLNASSTSMLHGLPTVFSDAGRWSLSTLIRWARMTGGEVGHPSGDLVIPGMPPDSYQVCPAGTTEKLARAGAECTAGELSAFSELTLEVPAQKR